MDLNIQYIMIVIPFFNEELYLADTCNSLGFGNNTVDQKNNIILILVDNNSTDNSISIANTIREHSLNQTVYITEELEKGFVPARHKGNLFAKYIANSNGIPETNVLIIQADADTLYSKEYCFFVKEAMEKSELNCLIESYTSYPSFYLKENPLFLQYCQLVDTHCSPFLESEDEDVIIDDKAASYILSDYFKWGGHSKEFNSIGSEIYAETSRLFMKAKATGAIRKKAENAFAVHSIRRIIEEPYLSFLTAGFPREKKWLNTYHILNTRIFSLDMLDNEQLDNAQKIRALHVLALFCILPAHVKNTIGQKITYNKVSSFAVSQLPTRNIKQLNTVPALFFEDIFNLIDKDGDYILNLTDYSTYF